MYLGFADRTVRKPHCGEAFHFPLAAFAVSTFQIATYEYASARRNGLTFSNLAEDFKF
jgi:hypothetical protein